MPYRVAAVLALVTCALALALMAVRVSSAVSFHMPLMASTSGVEEETAISIWRYVRGLDVYQHPHHIPFSAAAYNWLFYVLHGEVARIVLGSFGLPEVWLLTVSRLVTLALTAVGSIVTWYGFRALVPSPSFMNRLAAPFSIYLFFGPLVGFWAISLNMEVAATLFTAAATVVFCRWYDAASARTVIIASLLSLLAWSFKQSYVYAAGAIGLFLLLRGDWRGLATTVLIHIAGWSSALMLGSDVYFRIMFFVGMDATLSVTTLWRNVVNVAVKTTPTLAVVVVCACAVARRVPIRSLMADTPLLFSVCGTVVSAMFVVPFSAKIGAAENYYLALIWYLTFAAFAAARHLDDHAFGRISATIIAASWLLAGMAVLTVLTGMQGARSVSASHERHVAQQACLRGLPAPLFAVDGYLALPWMTEAEPRFVLFYTYHPDRKAGRPFERDGVAGLIRERYFSTIIMPAGAPSEFEGALLDAYERQVSNCAGLDIYLRR